MYMKLVIWKTRQYKSEISCVKNWLSRIQSSNIATYVLTYIHTHIHTYSYTNCTSPMGRRKFRLISIRGLQNFHKPIRLLKILGTRMVTRSKFYTEICALLVYTQRQVVIFYRRFGTTYRSHLQGWRSPRRLLRPWRWDRYVFPKRR